MTVGNLGPTVHYLFASVGEMYGEHWPDPMPELALPAAPGGLMRTCALTVLSLFAAGQASAGPAGLRGRQAVPEADSPYCQTDGVACVALLGITIDGASVLSQDDLATAYERYLMQPVNEARLVEIASAVTNLYRDRGYFLSQAIVPPQDLSGGMGRLVVVEGRISRIEVEGESAAVVAPMFADYDREGPASLKELDRRLALAKDIPGVTLRTHIIPVPDDPTRHTLVLRTGYDRDRAWLAINNRSVIDESGLHIAAGLSRNGVFSRQDQLTFGLSAAATDPGDWSQAELGYRYAFRDGGQVFAGVAASRANDGHDPDTDAVGGESILVSLGYQKALTRTRSLGVWGGASVDAGHFENDWFGGGGYRDELRVARVMLRGMQSADGATSTFFVQGSWGLDAFGASGSSADNRSRWNADATFAKAYARVTHYRDLGNHFGVFASLEGQWSPDSLLLSEEFAAGGGRLGRAYGYGEITGDSGFGGVLELRAGFDPDGDLLSFLQAYAFADYAEVWNENGPYEAVDLSLASAGLGLRADVLKTVTARVELAKPLTKTPWDESSKDWRSFFSLSSYF